MDLLQKTNKNPPVWANDILLPWNDKLLDQKRAFIQKHYWTGQGSVNVFNVVGTIHSDYANKSWLNLLNNGKRMSLNIPLLEAKPEYYHASDELKQPAMYYNTLDGIHYYIADDGNHRTCLARFYFYEKGLTQITGVNINHYHIDELFYSVYQQIRHEIHEQNLPVIIHPEKEAIKREDTTGWMTDCYRTSLVWMDAKSRQTEILNYEQSLDRLEWLQKRKYSLWARIVG